MTVMTSAIGAISRLPRRLGDWQRRGRTRRELGRMAARQLVDVGLSPAAVARECRQPFWRALGRDLAGPGLPPAVRPATSPTAAVFACGA